MEKENTENFLQVKKNNFYLGLKAIDLLIISQIKEFQVKGLDCYVTNEQFSWMFGESVSTVKRSIDRLEKLNIVKRNTICNRDKGKGKKRTLIVNNKSKWKINTKVHIEPWSNENEDITKVHIEPWSENTKVHIEPWSENTKVHIEPWSEYQGSNVDVPRFKNDPTKVHIEPIKDKEKIKENINNGHCVPSETAPSASSITLPSVAMAEKKNKTFKNEGNSMAKKISDICCCPIEEINNIINDNGLDYDSVLHCVENGYINGKNLYSKMHWESMDVDDGMRDDTYEEYLLGMYRSNPNGLDEAKPKNSYESNHIIDCIDSYDVDGSALANIDNDNDADISWLDGLSDWMME